jgi:hypothetical protein
MIQIRTSFVNVYKESAPCAKFTVLPFTTYANCAHPLGPMLAQIILYRSIKNPHRFLQGLDFCLQTGGFLGKFEMAIQSFNRPQGSGRRSWVVLGLLL